MIALIRVWALILLLSWNLCVGVSPCVPAALFQGMRSSRWKLVLRGLSQAGTKAGSDSSVESRIWAVLKGRGPSQLLKSEISCKSKLSKLLGGGGREKNEFSGKVFVLPLSSWANNLLEVSVSIHLL